MSVRCETTECSALLDPSAPANESGYCGICRRDHRKPTATTTTMKGNDD